MQVLDRARNSDIDILGIQLRRLGAINYGKRTRERMVLVLDSSFYLGLLIDFGTEYTEHLMQLGIMVP